MFNVFGAVIFTIFLLCWPGFMDSTLNAWFPGQAAAGLRIALFHTFFNVVCTCIFLPMTNLFVKISCKIIRTRRTRTALRAMQCFWMSASYRRLQWQ